MLGHIRLLRGTALLLAAVTLSSLQQQPEGEAGCWSAGWLLPVLGSLVLTAGCMAAALVADSATSVMHTIVVSLSLLHALMMMLYFLLRRRRLVALLRRAAALERATSATRRLRELRTVHVQFAVIVILSVTACASSQAEFFSGAGAFGHPRYPNPILLPAALQTPVWYWVICVLLVLHDVMVTIVNMAFDLLLIGVADVVALLLGRLASRLKVDQLPEEPEQLLEEDLSGDRDPGESSVEHCSTGKEVFVVGSEIRVNAMNGSLMGSEKSDASGGDRPVVLSSVKIGPAPTSGAASGLTSPPSETDLRDLISSHRAVRRLAADAADFCSVPLFSLYTSITGMLLLSIYMMIQDWRDGGDAVYTYPAYILLMLLRLWSVSLAGSRLLKRGDDLHDALTDAGWPRRRLSQPALLSLQLLLEQTRRPAALHGCGLFTAEKTTVLSILGFVLTYIVILIQMVHS